MVAFIRRNAVVILFVIAMVAIGLTYHRQENLIADNRLNALRAKELAVLVAQQTIDSQKALCDSRVEARTNLHDLLESIVSDYLTARPAARIELERRIDDALGAPPEDCTDVPGA